jgi:hypothetical protein
MAISIFNNKFVKPLEADIPAVLGESKPLWDDLKNFLEIQYHSILEEWKFYGSSSGWGLLLKNKSRTILYLYPCSNYFVVLFVFGEKAVDAVNKSALPIDLINKIKEAKRHTEGRSFFTDVKSPADLEIIKQLTEIKMKN